MYVFTTEFSLIGDKTNASYVNTCSKGKHRPLIFTITRLLFKLSYLIYKNSLFIYQRIFCNSGDSWAKLA